MIQRAVFDTSSLVGAALHVGSVPWSAIRLAIQSFEVWASPQTLAELQRVLEREHFNRYIPSADRAAFLEWYRSHIHLHAEPLVDIPKNEPPCRDPKDNIFLALAIAANADTIVSSDRDLLILHPWRGIHVLTPAQFLTQFAL